MSHQPFPEDAGTGPAAFDPSPAHGVEPPAVEPDEGIDELLDDLGIPEESPGEALPINDAPFGVSPARLSGRGPKPGRRIVSLQEAAAANRKLSRQRSAVASQGAISLAGFRLASGKR